MKTLVIAAIAALTLTLAASARDCPNSDCGMNGRSLNGIWENGIFQNGSNPQGSTMQGVNMQGTLTRGAEITIGSAILIEIQLLR